MMLFTLGAKIKNLIQAFKERVLSSQGEFEAESCLDGQLTDLDNKGLLDSASLIVTPNGYRETLLYAVEPNEVGTNLFVRSEQFENASWQKQGGSETIILPNVETAPNGTLTGDKMYPNTTGTFRGVFQVNFPINTYRHSVYAKKGGKDFLFLYVVGSTASTGCWFNLNTGTIGTVGSSWSNAIIENVGNGWYRCSATVSITNTINNIYYFVSDTNNSFAVTANGTDGIFLWGAQLVPSSSVTNYISTTDRQIINGTIGDMSVTRATIGTRVNSDGEIEQVPYNLFQRSEEFENAIWTKTNLSIIQNTQTSPIGNLTADTIRIGIDASSVRHRFNQQLVYSINTTYTTSYYLKKANHRWVQLIYVIDTVFGVNSWANFDLENGVIGNTGAGAIATIENVGNGWYRCSVQGTTLVGVSSTGCEILTTNNTNSGRYPPYQSSLAEDVCYIWGAQLVRGTQAKDYFPTTNRFNIPRIDYSNGSCPSILVEPQRTNLSLQSEDFTNGWSLEGTSITSNTQSAPDNLPSADTLSELTTNDVHRTYRSAITVTANALYTSSFFVKKNNIRYVRLVLTQNASTTIWAGAQFDLDTQTFTSQVGIGGGVFTSATITTFANGWFRISVVGSIPSTLMIPMLVLSNGDAMLNTDTRGCPVYLGNTSNSLYVWGAQLELGSNVTSYIPTIASTVTRNADVISNTNASTLIGQSEGTIFVDYNKVLAPDTPRNIIGFTDGTTNNLIEIWDGVVAANLGMLLYTCTTNAIFKSTGSGQTTISPSGRYKICLTYSFTPTNMNFKFFVNGVKLRDDNVSFTAFNNPLSRINIGNRNGTFVGIGGHNIDFISKTAITETQAIQLTTL